MDYLVCQDWENTTNNHAGMKHMANLLKFNSPDNYKVYIFADRLGNKKRNFWGRIEWQACTKVINPASYFLFAIYLVNQIKKGDRVFLLEYMEKVTPQNRIAEVIKKLKPEVKVLGLVHLTPSVLENAFTQSEIQNWTFAVDNVITMGSSLSSYFVKRGVPQSKISTLFHYVDLEYYKNLKYRSSHNDRIIVIAMGNQKRNYNILSEIIKANPNVSFVVCKGVSDIDHIFNGYSNVKLVGFVCEDKLKELMQEADISLNVMDDTIGSNVITTSIAMGLAMIVSDVGSIRDYCKEDGAIYCNNDDVSSFSNAIRLLDADRDRLDRLKRASLDRSHIFSVRHFHTCLKHL
ncbi:glycosyltransferase family 4 protein [Mucilaginibacter calamicampi]|uniref:Glycosyltransferase family 4 protein n=1 Tax=Mucilaginibacter calamicampi TaxID=1302352 RepID=A0ABW2Z274_9SPHI